MIAAAERPFESRKEGKTKLFSVWFSRFSMKKTFFQQGQVAMDKS